MLHASWQAVKTRWENTLSAELARGRWDVVPEPAFSLPAPGATVTTNQEGIKHIEAISTEALKTRRRNPRAWAQREIGRAHSELQSLMRISYAVFCLKKK